MHLPITKQQTILTHLSIYTEIQISFIVHLSLFLGYSDNFPCGKRGGLFAVERYKMLPPARGRYKMLPPARRPRRVDVKELDSSFIVDFENSILKTHFEEHPFKPHPVGRRRFEDPAWAALVQRFCFPQHSDVDWEEYVSFCLAGGGDEWFEASTTDSMETLNGSAAGNLRDERATGSEEPQGGCETPRCRCHHEGSAIFCREPNDHCPPTAAAVTRQGHSES